MIYDRKIRNCYVIKANITILRIPSFRHRTECNNSKYYGTLNGKCLREIAAELDISKDATANVIKDWKNGKINFLQNSIPEGSS